MRKISMLFVALAFSVSVFAGVNVVVEPSAKPKPLHASEVMIPIGKDGVKISLLDLATMKVKSIEALTGKKMNLADKVGFTIAQKQLRSNINEDGTFNNKKIAKAAAKKAPDGSGFNIGGFALGFLLGLIGVLIAYIISDDKKKERTKWAWIGFAAFLVLWLIFLVL